MRVQLARFVLLLLGLLTLGSVALLMGAWATRWPRLQGGFVRLGDAAITFALGLVGLFMVVLTLRFFGWWPTP